MKVLEFGRTIVTGLLLQASIACAKHNNVHLNALERKHRHHNRETYTSKAEIGEEFGLRTVDVEKRGGQCQFPSDANLVAVTPGKQNAGWAMSPDQPCTPGNYCPYACPPGQMMAQWDPDATSYTYPQSMNGGLYCDKDGNIHKPFPDKEYCMGGKAKIGALNKAGDTVSFCQTVLPGNEAMLIPTSIEDWEQLAVPDPSYWCGTAAHFYINPPGVGTHEACVWGTKENPWGNWSPYVAGANTDHSGNTFVKLAWNPIYLEPATPFRDVMPKWGVEIVCDGEGCNGLPCAIDPSQNKINEMVGSNSDGAGGANFCVVTVPEGVNANFVVFDGGLSSAGDDSGSGKSGESSSSPVSSVSFAAAPSIAQKQQVAVGSSSSTSSPTPSPLSSSTAPSTTSLSPSTTPAPSSTSDASSSSSAEPSTSSSSEASSSSVILSISAISTNTTTSSYAEATTTTNVTSTEAISSYSPHILLQNGTATYSSAQLAAQTTAATGSEGGPMGSGGSPGLSQSGGSSGGSSGSAATGISATGTGYRRHVTGAVLCLSLLAAIMVLAL